MTSVQFYLSWQEYYQAERVLHQKTGIVSVPIFRQWRLKTRWARKPILRAQHQVSFDSDGIFYLLDGIESNLDWKYFHRWSETKEGFLLIREEDVFSLIPKRAFENPKDVDQFRQLLSTKLLLQ